MKHFMFAAALLLTPATLAFAQDDGGLPAPGKPALSSPIVNVDNFGTVTLDIDMEGADPHVANQSLWLRRSDDGNSNDKTLEQWSNRTGRWKDSVNTQAFFPRQADHDQVDSPKIPFTNDFFGQLNAAIANGALARSTTLSGKDPVKFKLTFDPKGHLPKGHDDKVTIQGTLHRDDGGHLSFAADPSDAEGQKIAPLVNGLVAQLESTNKTQDQVESSVILFGTTGSNGQLVLSNTTQSCAVDGVQAATPSTSYAVSDDTAASLRSLLANQVGKNVVVRAILTGGKNGSAGSAQVLGIMGGLGWKAPILNAPGGRAFENGGTLMNNEDAEVSSGRVGNDRVGIEITGDPSGDYLTIRAPNYKGSLEPNVGYVKKSDVTLLLATPTEGSTYQNVDFEKAAAGMTAILGTVTSK